MKTKKTNFKIQKTSKKPINKIYPLHAEALKVARIAPEKFATFSKIETLNTQYTNLEKETKEGEKKNKRSKQTFFCIGVSQSSTRRKTHPPFYQAITRLRNKYNLRRLRVSVSYHKFSNLSQQFQSDLTSKL